MLLTAEARRPDVAGLQYNLALVSLLQSDGADRGHVAGAPWSSMPPIREPGNC